MQDDRALRVALLARPRVSQELSPGDLVAYWRNQKWVQGKLQVGGRWYGTAVILGKVGRNFVFLHRRQVIRRAPEQIRPTTNEEKTMLSSPQVEMLGIKDLIEQGSIRSQQFLDLLPQSYPSMDQPDVESVPEGHVPKDESAPVAAPNTADQPEPNVEARATASEAMPDNNPPRNAAMPQTGPDAPESSSSASGEIPLTNPGDNTYGLWSHKT